MSTYWILPKDVAVIRVRTDKPSIDGITGIIAKHFKKDKANIRIFGFRKTRPNGSGIGVFHNNITKITNGDVIQVEYEIIEG